ncbi:Uu.00g019410.m01.CDS01 [Anthostomella pinea]|uniref:Uu.00g019410.m01.CDS01 n=1 Tax=Anthostomella pinea TaxID=933095 RepID=A0AAI8VZB1_9PEZI|nr:Uu.00g019410.m01.CDS01 [Anthostomella pinea]
MARQIAALATVLVAGLALFLSQRTRPLTPQLPRVIGRNNTVLFVTQSENGMSNVLTSTAHALLEHHPQIHIHYASFADVAPRLERISSDARTKTAAAREIVFHEIPGQSLADISPGKTRPMATMIFPPGREGIEAMMGSGFPYPVPWSKIPENIYLNMRLAYAMLTVPDAKAKQDFLKSKGLTKQATMVESYSPHAPWFAQNLEGAARPLAVIPQNVTATGPMSISLAPAAEQDPELTAWLAQAPNVMINLGSAYVYDEPHAAAMAQALVGFPDGTSFQVLWKFRKDLSDDYSDDFAVALRPFIASGRVRMENWLATDPTALLEMGHIVASVHHGGSCCYHEAISAGVPHVVLPWWADHYDFAQMVEDINVGVWGCRETSPYWTPDCLRDAFRKVAESAQMRDKAKKLGEVAKRGPGQYLVAREIAKLAAAGKGV